MGRTARGGAVGSALSLVTSESRRDQSILAKVQATQPRMQGAADSAADSKPQPAPLPFNVADVERFRYRVEDVRRAVTKRAVRDARVREIKNEMLNSERLKEHFAANPKDRQLLQHAVALKPAQVQPHLARIPSYLMPGKKGSRRSGDEPAVVGHRTKKRGGAARAAADADDARRKRKKHSFASVGGKANSSDPLLTFRTDQSTVTGPNNHIHAKKETELEKADMAVAEGFGRSTSGRNTWKQKHKKGKWSRKFQANKAKPF